jgi:DNA-binding response OmpR family regulator
MCDALREVLLLSGFLVTCAGNGLVANALAVAEAYDILLSDIRLPGMDGITLARRLLKRPCPPQIILLTSYPEWKVYEEAADVGVAAILCKPVNLHQLVRIVDAIARRPRPAA